VTWSASVKQVRLLSVIIEQKEYDKGLSEDGGSSESSAKKANEPAFLAGNSSAGLPPVVLKDGGARLGQQVSHPVIDYQSLIYYACAQATRRRRQSCDEVDSESCLENRFDKLVFR